LDLDRLEGEVSIGCNAFFLGYERWKVRPTFYTVEDRLVAADRGGAISALENTRRVVPLDLIDNVGGLDTTYVNFHREYWSFPRMTRNFAKRAYWGGTVTYFNIQLALHIGASEIILIGLDHSYRTGWKIAKDGGIWTSQEADQNHFDPRYFGPGFKWHDPKVERMELGYSEALRECTRRGVKIWNATAGGHLEVFPRREFAEFFQGNDV